MADSEGATVANEEPMVEEEDVAPLPDDREHSVEEVRAATEQVEKAKQISREAFERGLRRALNLAIEGYPRALRSTLSRRNELLRKHRGDQDAAVDDVKAQASDMREEAKSWLLGAVPYVGLPSSVLYPTWRALRRCCLLASIYGLPLDSEDTRAKIVHVFCGMRAVPIGEYALETAIQMAWTAVAGPIASKIPVGILASKLANVEGHVMGIVGHDTFTEERQHVSLEEYEQELDREPTRDDMLGLLRDSTVYGLLLGRNEVVRAWDVAKDKERREATAVAAASFAIAAASWAAGTTVTVGKGAKDTALGVAAAGVGVAKEGVAKGLGLVGGLLGGKKPAPQLTIHRCFSKLSQGHRQ